jgi:hypothetical protein
LNFSPHFTLPTTAGMADHLQCPVFGWDGGVSQTFCLGWPQTTVLLISASQVAKITSMHHWCLAWIGFCLC